MLPATRATRDAAPAIIQGRREGLWNGTACCPGKGEASSGATSSLPGELTITKGTGEVTSPGGERISGKAGALLLGEYLGTEASSLPGELTITEGTGEVTSLGGERISGKAGAVPPFFGEDSGTTEAGDSSGGNGLSLRCCSASYSDLMRATTSSGDAESPETSATISARGDLRRSSKP